MPRRARMGAPVWVSRQIRRTGDSMFARKQRRVTFMDFTRWSAGQLTQMRSIGQVRATATRWLRLFGEAGKPGAATPPVQHL